MGLFDFLKKKEETVTCVRCDARIPKTNAMTFNGQLLCPGCYSRADALRGGNSEGRTNRGGGQSAGTSQPAGTTSGNGIMPDAIQDVKRSFDQAKLKYTVNHVGDQWEVVAGINGKANTYQLKFICKESAKGDLAMRIYRLTHFSQERWGSVYPVLQGFQRKYRFLKFHIDGDGDVNLEYDFPGCTTNVGACAVEMLIRTMKIVDDIYPELMRLLWA